MLDYLIKNGVVINGVDPEPVRQNIGIAGDRIVFPCHSKISASEVIDADGLYITPGFIDVHAHSEFILLLDGRAEGKLSQGITTEINGNCGLSAAPLYGEAFEHRQNELQQLGLNERWHNLQEYLNILQNKGIALNIATLCGHGNLRASVMGYDKAICEDHSLKKMQELFRASLSQGAIGLSTGLIYPPGIYSDVEEITGLLNCFSGKNKKGKSNSAKKLIYTSHMRSEGDHLLEAIEEIITVGKTTGVPIHISHIKTSGEENWNKIDKAIDLIEDAKFSGIEITCDSYPYTASSTDLDSILPEWVFEGGVKEELKRLKNPQKLKIIRADLSSKPDKYWKNVYISQAFSDKNRWTEGESIYDIAIKIGKKPVDTVINIIVDEEARAGAIFFTMNEENLRRLLSLPYVMIGSDSSARSFSGPTCKGKPHPRGFGTFPRFIGRYVRDEDLIPLPEAIKRITSLPAKTFGIKERGIIKDNYFADIVIFDYNQIKDRSSYKNPFMKSDGIEYVFVNGSMAVKKGELTGTLSGKTLV